MSKKGYTGQKVCSHTKEAPATNFNSINAKPAPVEHDNSPRGTPDIPALRRKIERAMKKFRRV